MKILVVGAGATGGYFGGRLLEAGQDVTFVVRAKRKDELKRRGLEIRSPFGNVVLADPPTVTAETLREPFDLVLLSCKAYDLEGAMESFAPAVGTQTLILPLLNGMRHLGVLDARFGASHVLGGMCLISSVLDAEGRIVHMNDSHVLSFGPRESSQSTRKDAIAAALSGARFDARLSDNILQAMWEKWVFIAAFAGITCLMRASIGDIIAADGTALATGMLEECAAIATQQGFSPSEFSLARSRGLMTTAGSPLTASMLRDLERGGPIEADHIVGDLLRHGEASPLLRIAYAHLKAYELRREREKVKRPD